MFEHLDDPNGPAPGPLDRVVARGRQLRLHRRLVIAATAMFVIAGSIATVGALQGGGGHDRVRVTNEPSSSTAVSPTSTAPDNAAPGSTTPSAGATSPTTVAGFAPSPGGGPNVTATTQPPHDPNDLAMVTVTYAGETGVPDSTHFAIPTGESKPLSYTVTNNGSWAVNVDTCAGPVYLWSDPATKAWPPYTDGIWPAPYPTRGTDEVTATPSCAPPQPLAPGASETRSLTLVAGYQNAAGDVMPAPPGYTAVRVPFLPQCTQPCDYNLTDAVHVTIEPPHWPPPPSLYSIVYKTPHMSIPSGQSADAEIVYTNGLAFTVQIPLFGPCWHDELGDATVDCSGPIPVLTIHPGQTADLHGTVWAKQGFVQSGAPLAPGRYMINMGDTESETIAENAAQATWVDVS
jgi:hypothetical protein